MSRSLQAATPQAATLREMGPKRARLQLATEEAVEVEVEEEGVCPYTLTGEEDVEEPEGEEASPVSPPANAQEPPNVQQDYPLATQRLLAEDELAKATRDEKATQADVELVRKQLADVEYKLRIYHDQVILLEMKVAQLREEEKKVDLAKARAERAA